MNKLQLAQKALVDLGLTTRVSIDLAMRRPSRDRVNRTLQDITALRAAMRRFEELLSQAELQVLEAAGVLWEGTAEPADGRRVGRGVAAAPGLGGSVAAPAAARAAPRAASP